MTTRISRRTFLCQAGVTALVSTRARLLAAGPSQPTSRFDVPLTLDLRDATSREAANILFEIAGLNHLLMKDVYGFVSVLCQEVHFETALRMLLTTANPKLTYSVNAGIYVIGLRRDSPFPPTPDAPLPQPDPPLIQPSDLLPFPTHPTLETIPRRVSGILLWADGRRGAILEMGGPFTGNKRIIREGDLVPSGVPDEPDLRVQWIGHEGVVLSRHKGKSLTVPLTDLTPYRKPIVLV